MRAIYSIGVLGFVCIFLAACQTAEESSPGERPYALIGAAYLYYSGTPGHEPAPKLAANTLRILFLWEKPAFIEKNRRLVAAKDWPQGFKDLLDKAIAWKRETLEKGPAHVYRLSNEYAKRPNAREDRFDSLSYNLLDMAAEMGHAKARAELPHRRNPVDNPEFRAGLLEGMFQNAKKNYHWAQIYLVQEYLYSKHGGKNPLKAYYWLLRAKANGRDISTYLLPLSKMLSPADKELVRDWIEKGPVPDL